MLSKLIHFDPQYMIEFEPTHRQWIVIDTENYEGELGYYYKKEDAKSMADMLNERSALLARCVTVKVISTLLDDEADDLMKASDPAALSHPRASSNLISDVGFSVDRIRILSNQLKDAIKADGGGQ